MKKLNIKFLVIILVPVTIAVFAVMMEHGRQSTKLEQDWLDRAELAEEEGRYEDALKDLKKYQFKHPEDVECQRRLGYLAAKIFLEAKVRTIPSFKEARAQLLQANRLTTENDEERTKLQRQLVEVLVQGGRLDEAEEYIKELLRKYPRDVELTYYAAAAAEALKRDSEDDNPEIYLTRIVGFLPDATKPPYFDQQAALDNNHIEAYWGLANYYRTVKRLPDQADRVIEGMRAINENPDEITVSAASAEEGRDARTIASEACFYYGQYGERFLVQSGLAEDIKKQREKSRSYIVKATEIDPSNVEAMLAVADYQGLDGDMKAARKTLKSVLEADPETVPAYLKLAFLSEIEQNYDEAITQLDAGLRVEKLKGNPDLLWKKAFYQLQKKDGQGMRATIEEMKQHNIRPIYEAIATALLPMCDQEWNRAARMLENVRPRIAGYDSFRQVVELRLADCYKNQNELDRAIQLYGEMAAHPVYGKSDKLLFRYATALRESGQLREAAEQLYARQQRAEQAGEQVPDRIARLSEIVSRELAAKKIPADTPSPIRSDTALEAEDVAGSPSDWVEDERYWEKVFTKVRLLLDDPEKEAQAFDVIRESLDVNKKHIDALPADKQEAARGIWANAYFMYVGLILEKKGEEEGRLEALEALNRLRDQQGDNPRIVNETAGILARKPGKETRGKLQQLEERVKKFVSDQQAISWMRLGVAYFRTGRSGYGDSKRCFKKAAELVPNHKPTLQQLFDFARQTGDDPTMLDALDRIKKAVGQQDPLWKYARASYLISSVSGNESSDAIMDEALRLANQGMEVRPNWGVLSALRGQIHEARGNRDEALADYENALAQGTENIRLISRILEMRIRAGEIAEAQAVLDTVGPAYPGLERIRAYLKILRGGEFDETIEAIDVAIPDKPNWTSYVEKGELYRQMTFRFREEEQVKLLHDKAEEAFRSAISMGRYNPRAWLALVNFLVGTKRSLPDAEAVLREAENELPDDLARPVLAQGYIGVRDYEQAEHYWLALLDANPDNMAVVRRLVNYYYHTEQLDQVVHYLQSIIGIDDPNSPENQESVLWARRQMANLLLEKKTHTDFQEALKYVDANEKAVSGSYPDMILKAKILASRPEPRYKLRAMKLLEFIYQDDPRKLNLQGKLLLARYYFRDAATPADERWRKCRRIMDGLIEEEQTAGEERTPQERALVHGQFASMLMEHGEAEQASAHVRVLSQVSPEDPSAIRLLAKWQLARNDRRAAQQAIEKLIPIEKITQDNQASLLQAAQIFDELGLDERAEQVYRRYAEEYPSGNLQLAQYLAGRGGSQQADEAFGIARELAKSKALRDLGMACHVGLIAIQNLDKVDPPQWQLDEMEGWFREARTANGSQRETIQLRQLESSYATHIGEHDRAARILRLLLDPKKLSSQEEGLISNNLAYLLAARGEELKYAEQLVDRAQELLGPNVSLLDTMGVVHLMRGDCEEAVKVLEESTSMDASVLGSARRDQASEAQMYFHLALAYKCVGDRGMARQAWENAQSRGFRISDARPLKTELYEELRIYLR